MAAVSRYLRPAEAGQSARTFLAKIVRAKRGYNFERPAVGGAAPHAKLCGALNFVHAHFARNKIGVAI